MGNYNPRSPLVLGEEWVPIRDEQLVYTPFVNAVERGTMYEQVTDTRVQDLRFYVNEMPSASVVYHVGQANLYPAGLEDLTGPIQQVIIPVSSVTATGSVSVVTTLTSSLSQPGDSNYLGFPYDNGNEQKLSLWFAVDQYPELANKRILNVSLLYAGNVSDANSVSQRVSFVNPTANSSSMTVVYQRNDLAQGQQFLGKAFAANTGALTDLSSEINPITSNPFTNQTVATLDLGDVNNCWDPNNLGVATGAEKLPWRYADLLRLQETYGAGRQHIELSVVIPSTGGGGTTGNVIMYLDYVALQVTYCEERRIAYGGQQFSYAYGMNKITMRDLSQAANPIVPAGTYLPTLSFVSMGQVGFGGTTQGAFPQLNAVRQLYEIPSHHGVDLNVPFPMSDHLGETFDATTAVILPQISLHASGTGGTLTGPHVYGRQAAARVYGTNTATQGVYDALAGAAGSYPQVRFYARRFGDTTIPLTVTNVVDSVLSVPGVAGSYASTPDNAALDITGDIDLRVEMSMTQWASGVFVTPLSKWNQNGVNQRGYAIQVSDTGLLALVWSPDGTSVLQTFSTAAVPVGTGRLAIRAAMDVNDGAGNRLIAFYTAPTIDGPWVRLGSLVTTPGTTSIFSNNSQAQISGHSGSFGADAIAYLVYKAQILNGIDGTAVANPDFTTQPAGTTSFADAAGRTWSTNGTAAIIGGTVTAGASASIDAATFDELPEILDGWREVTLRFGTAATLGASTGPTSFRWSAPGELSGNRWEILGASAPAVSGIPGNRFNQVPYPNALGVATYQPPAGMTADLTWMPQGVATQWVTGAVYDQFSDAALMLSQDPALVTGVGLSALTQTVSGIGSMCGSVPCCIPTGIGYNRVTWSMQGTTSLVRDSFDRTVATGMGSPDVGSGSYTLTDIGSAYAVTGTLAKIAPSSTTPALAVLGVSSPDFDITAEVGTYATITSGTTARAGLAGRYTDASNYYVGFIEETSGSAPVITVRKVVAGVSTTVFTSASPLGFDGGGNVWLRFMGYGSLLKLKVWAGDIEAEPAWWNIETSDTALTTGNNAGLWANSAAAGNALTFDSLLITPPRYAFGAYELQRWDAVTGGDFETIMLGTDITTTGFSDFEARVGQTSVYRIRALNALNFAGLWSTYVSGAPPAPGISGGCSDQTGALIFTSNGDQTGANNAAYVMQWDGTPNESFTLPEADRVQYQEMYGRDGVVAFHGTERGLERFSRDVLLQAGAIALPSLADAADIRDLAWDSLPYVCVRDGRGNRWFASVRVPTTNARNDAQAYMARLDIVETTRTAYPVDP